MTKEIDYRKKPDDKTNTRYARKLKLKKVHIFSFKIKTI